MDNDIEREQRAINWFMQNYGEKKEIEKPKKVSKLKGMITGFIVFLFCMTILIFLSGYGIM